MTGKGLGGARWLASTRSDGDLRPASEGAIGRQSSLLDLPWTSSRQMHGATILEIERPIGALAGEADGLVSAVPDVPLAMFGADCALVALSSEEGPIGVAHAGWKGVSAGVIEASVERMRALGAGRISATVSAMIEPECYEFSAGDLERLAAEFGDGVRSTTSDGRPAFDLPSAVRIALQRVGVEFAGSAGGCTACDGNWFSWRARREEQRHALVCWRPSA